MKNKDSIALVMNRDLALQLRTATINYSMDAEDCLCFIIPPAESLFLF